MAGRDDTAGEAFDPMADISLSDRAGDAAPDVVEGSLTEATSRSWFERLTDAIVGVLIGILLVLATCGGLFWNEGRAVQTARSLAEGAGLVVDIDPGRVNPSNEGKLIHLQGDLKTSTPLVDTDLLVSAEAAKLLRTVEMYQWKEETRTETRKKLGGGEETVTHYSYTRVWADRRINSGSFHRSGHENPPMRYAKFETAARDASLGAFHPGPAALARLPAQQELRVDDSYAERLRAKFGSGPVHVTDGRIYLGADPAHPRVGDLRVSYHVASTGSVSLIGRQTGDDVAEYQTKAGDRLLLAATGLVPASDMFRQAERENQIFTWILRLVGLLVMWIGWFLILRPIAVVGDVAPLIGSVLGAGVGIASTLLTAVLAPLVIAIAWLWYRPLLSVGLTVAAVAVAYGIRMLAHHKQPRAPSTERGSAPPGAGVA